MRRGAGLVLALSALVLTAACGSGDEKKTGTDSTAQGEKGGIRTEGMPAVLLAVEDLPPGYKPGQPGPTGGATTKAAKPECQPIAAFLDERIAGATLGGSVDFEGPGGSTQLSQQMFTLPGTGSADLVRDIGAAVGQCARFDATVGGETMTIGVQPIDGPKVGEESRTLNLTTEIKQLQMTFDIQVLVASEGVGLTRLTHVPGKPADRKNFADLARRAGDKFVRGMRG
ncbi:hypothetical protein [Streptomyces yaizuensis]|nr:hypothetical protein [Streptomyces sp. YSPA8]